MSIFDDILQQIFNVNKKLAQNGQNLYKSTKSHKKFCKHGFQPSLNIMMSPTSYMGFIHLSGFMHRFSYRIDIFFLFFHTRRHFNVFLRVLESRFSEGWTLMTETSVLVCLISLVPSF